jgi:hypothetical protein
MQLVLSLHGCLGTLSTQQKPLLSHTGKYTLFSHHAVNAPQSLQSTDMLSKSLSRASSLRVHAISTGPPSFSALDMSIKSLQVVRSSDIFVRGM